MKIKSLILLVCLIVLLPMAALAGPATSPKTKKYKRFARVESFASITLRIDGKGAAVTGLDEEELTAWLRFKFREIFKNAVYEERPPGKKYSVKEKQKLGRIWCRVWLIGSDYPIVYHISCNGGNFIEHPIWTNEVLGYGSKSNVPQTVKKTLTKFIGQLSVIYYRAKGEL